MLYISCEINSELQDVYMVKLKDIIEAIEFLNDETTAYLNKKTGAIMTITDEDFSAAENQESQNKYPEWQRDNIKRAGAILANEKDFIMLPNKYDVHEYQIMEKFCISIANKDISEALYNAIKGRGAFRRFKEKLNRYEIADQWYEYREEAIRQIVIDWCESNHIPFDGG
jgi:hypothetical protein